MLESTITVCPDFTEDITKIKCRCSLKDWIRKQMLVEPYSAAYVFEHKQTGRRAAIQLLGNHNCCYLKAESMYLKDRVN